MRATETVNCAYCNEPFERELGKPGRPRKYCTDEHRIAQLKAVFQPAYQQRQKRKRWAHAYR